MKSMLIPATGIIVVTIVLLILNYFTDSTILKDFALLFIIAGMLIGVWLTKIGNKTNRNEN